MTDYTASTCRIPGCSKRIEIPADLNVPPEPADLTKHLRVLAVFAAFQRHVQKAHPEIWRRIEARSRELAALQMLQVFEHEDQSLQNRMDQTRAVIHREVGITIDDGMLQHRIAGLGLNNGDAGKVFAFCKELRDVFTEAFRT